MDREINIKRQRRSDEMNSRLRKGLQIIAGFGSIVGTVLFIDWIRNELKKSRQ